MVVTHLVQQAAALNSKIENSGCATCSFNSDVNDRTSKAYSFYMDINGKNPMGYCGYQGNQSWMCYIDNCTGFESKCTDYGGTL